MLLIRLYSKTDRLRVSALSKWIFSRIRGSPQGFYKVAAGLIEGALTGLRADRAMLGEAEG